MKLLSILRLSLHNLWQNKLRTLLTIIVLAVVSFVVVLLFGVGYSFYASVNKNVDAVFQTYPTTIDVNYKVPYTIPGDSYDYSGTGKFTLDEVERLLKILDNDDGYITSVGFFDPTSSYFYGPRAYNRTESGYGESYYILPFYAGSNPFVGLKSDGSNVLVRDSDNYLEAGRMWNKTDEGTKNVWLPASAMAKYGLGDEITVTLENYEYYDRGLGKTESLGSETALTYKIAGFLNIRSDYSMPLFVEYHNFTDTRGSRSVESWVGYNSNVMAISNIYATMIPQEGYTYGIDAQNYLKSLVKQLDSAVTPSEPGAEMSTFCSILDMQKMIMILVLVIFGLALFVSLIIVLLSIGSVANTIKISAEQNRKFFGVMKAIGMKNKSLRHILIGQIIIMAIVGVGIASLGAYLIIGVAKSILSLLLGGLFYVVGEPIVVCTISPIIPVAIVLILIGFVLLFTRSKLHAFSKMDVISVINEVN